jgi:hypothetical protein
MGRNKYFRSTPLEYGLISLGGYLRFWALVFLVVTAWLAFVKKEDAVSENDPDMDVKKVYKVMWSIIRLKSMLLQPTYVLVLIARYPVLPHRPPSLQNRFPSKRFGNITQTPRKGSPQGGSSSSCPTRFPSPDGSWMVSC